MKFDKEVDKILSECLVNEGVFDFVKGAWEHAKTRLKEIAAEAMHTLSKYVGAGIKYSQDIDKQTINASEQFITYKHDSVPNKSLRINGEQYTEDSFEKYKDKDEEGILNYLKKNLSGKKQISDSVNFNIKFKDYYILEQQQVQQNTQQKKPQQPNQSQSPKQQQQVKQTTQQQNTKDQQQTQELQAEAEKTKKAKEAQDWILNTDLNTLNLLNDNQLKNEIDKFLKEKIRLTKSNVESKEGMDYSNIDGFKLLKAVKQRVKAVFETKHKDQLPNKIKYLFTFADNGKTIDIK